MEQEKSPDLPAGSKSEDLRSTTHFPKESHGPESNSALYSEGFDDPDPDQLVGLGIAHGQRFQQLGDLDDSEKAVNYISRAVSLTPDDHPNLAHRLGILGVSHRDRFLRLGELDDIKKSIELKSRAVSLLADNDPSLAHWLVRLGTSYGDRFHRLGEVADIEKAFECISRGVSLTPDDDLELASRLDTLGTAHRVHFKRFGDLANIEKSIEYITRSVSLTPDNDPNLPQRLDSLGLSYQGRFQRLGELNDIEQSISYKSRAVSLTLDDDRNLARLLDGLGLAYQDRFQLLGELDDVEKAIDCETRAVSLTPDHDLDLARRLSNLGTSHRTRFGHLERSEDIKKAIDYKSRAVSMTPDNDPNLARLLEGLGIAHGQRYSILKEPVDIDKAVEHMSRSVSLTGGDDPNLARQLINLATSYRDRFWCMTQYDDLEKAAEHASHALDLTPEGHPDFPYLHNLLAEIHLDQYHFASESTHRQSALESFRKATLSRAGPPGVRFNIALKWAGYASEDITLDRIEAYQMAINLLPQFVWLGATANQRYQDLGSAKSLANAAASAAINSSNYMLALEWLEHTRCVVWNQSLMLRSPLDQLQSCNPALANQLQQVAAQLHVAGSKSRAPRALASDLVSQEQAGQQHRRLAREYDSLLTQARELPGFDDFLRPKKTNDLVRAARNGPIVVINCHVEHCDALLILPGQDNIDRLPLPNITEKKILRIRTDMIMSLKLKGLRERGIKQHRQKELGHAESMKKVLATLWSGVVKPILDYLGYMSKVSTDTLPHITWCPTGAISFLPLHAAGDYDQPHSRVFDYVVSSYTPTLTALLASTPTALTSTSRVLAIGQERTPGHSPLPGTTKELTNMKGHIEDSFGYTELTGDQATTTVVLDAMEQHDWVHLACHAHQNVEDPTKSGFHLHDGTLDLDSINRRSFSNKGLAFLSACQTATGDENLPDEAVHLASGMLMAGYSSVIATMWSVVDEDAPFVADRVYSQLMKGKKVGNGEAGKALYNAVAELREKLGEKEFGRWMPYIHIGS